MNLVRGQVCAATIPPMDQEKYYLVVSNNRRNKALETVLVARITSSEKPNLSSIVSLPAGECVYGRVLCDDLVEMWPDDDVRTILGGLSTAAMRLVDAGLRSALALE
jgi:mRNA interferase MazF